MAHAKVGGHLTVPNVQALAQTWNGSGEHLPERYVRTEEPSDKEVVAGYALPVVDLGRLLDPQTSEEEIRNLGSACQLGFFQLINHGVPDEVLQDMKRAATEFFKLPLDVKKVHAQLPDRPVEGYGQSFVLSETQKLDWADILYLMLRPAESRDMRFWPLQPPSFRDSVHRYSTEAANLVSILLRFMAADMGVDPERLQEMFGGMPQTIRVTYYPPCRQANNVIGLSPHTDACGLTLLLHIDDVQGLQIRGDDGKWLAIEPLDGAFIVSIGDAFEILSNGRYTSVEHRAVVNPDKERLSAALFHMPCPSVTIGPLPELVEGGATAQYKTALAQALNGSGEHVPERYVVRTEVPSNEEIVTGCAIPVVDLCRLLDPQTSEEELCNLGSACQLGFFQLINHGVPDEVLQDVKRDISEFFKLPLETKKAHAQLPNSVEGYGQVFVFSETQKLDWADMMYLMLRPTESRDMRFWPVQPPSFRDSVDRYSTEATKVVSSLLRFMAADMGVDPERVQEMFTGQPQTMRVSYYPPCRQASKVIGLSPHTDASGLTLLLHINDVQGLQIRSGDGKWLAVEPLDGAFVISIGDIFEILSNGRYRSVEHRAVINPNKERMSAAIFHQPCPSITVGPLPELVEGATARYKSVGYAEFMERFFSTKLDGRRSNLEQYRI
ncbi:hypothetical protein QOZ80_1AG0013980 [Eleusine coracana subsp. coracana]|nr:hypothetical protein QOZ80_1AG0013980 [Eleusine coracana subsp. coracana]